jgi:peptidoglycan hydrolase-like protein with peptidoglycan-binding domain
MTPGQARGTLVCFAFLLAGVTVNAVYLQENLAVGGVPRPARTLPPARAAPPRAVSEQEAPALRIARFAAEPQPQGGGASAAGVSHETVRAIQVELAAQGFGPVPNDGSLGLATRAAIMAYEHDHGLALTAMPSEQLLKRLLLGGGDGTPAHPAAEATTGEAKQVIASVERALADLGYLPGSDGRFTAETERAIREFELDKGLVPKGRISAELVRQLKVTAAKPAPR